MKNLKKVLALAVAFVLCFTMFAGALLFTDVEPGKDYSEAITLLSDLGVISGLPDGSFGINIAITRADAACLIARLVTGETNPPKNFGNIVFTDVPTGSYYETSVAYCAALGITSGTGGGKFSPERTISDAEFIAMVTRALGYDTAEAPLSYPWGNITVAQAKGLLEGVNVDYQSAALRGEDAQILYNALFADYDKAAKNKNVYQHADDFYTVTLAEEVFNLGWLCHDDNPNPSDNTRDTDFRSTNVRIPRACDAHTWVIAGVDARNSENTYVAFAIDDETEKAVDPDWTGWGWGYVEFTYDGDVEPYLGYRVELWGEMIHTTRDSNSGTASNVYDVVAIKTVEGQSAYDYNAGPLYDGDDNNKFVGLAEETLIGTRDNNVLNMANIRLRDNNWETVEKVNGRAGDAYTLATVYEKDAYSADPDVINAVFADGDQYKLIDWDSDGYLDFAVRTTYKYGGVASISKARVVLEAADAKNRGEGEVALKLDDDNEGVRGILLVTGAEGLEEDDVVEVNIVSRVYDRADGETVTIALTQVNPETKTLEKINLTKNEYTFDGALTYTADYDLYDRVEGNKTDDELGEKDNIGHPFDLYLDRNGFILKAVPNDDTARGYLMILDTVDGTSNLNTNKNRGLAAIDVLFDDNTTADEVPVVKDLRIDGSNSANGYDKSDRTWNQLQVVGNVYKYYMNDDGQITKLESRTDNQRADYSFDDSKDRLSVMNENNANYTNYSFAKDAVVFAAKQARSIVNGEIMPVTNNIGYVRVKVDATHDSSGNVDWSDPHNSVRYYVDADDVIAVKVEDVPEIDNRVATRGTDGYVLADDTIVSVKNRNAKMDAAGQYKVLNWSEKDVTHPAEFLPTLTFVTDHFEYKTDLGANKINNLQNKDWGNPNYPNDFADSYLFSAKDAHLDNNAVAEWITNNLDNLTYPINTLNKNLNQGVPRVAFSLDSKGDVDVALLGVDTLDYFNQSEVKLALITDVYAHGKDTYSIDAAIEGKVENFKTVSDDEEDIFVGRLDSYDDMYSYLNQSQRDTDGRREVGARNGLYAEVTMNSEGLITKIRAMDMTTIATQWYNSDKRVVETLYAEGNVYRVVRGVVDTIKTGSKSTQVTWQANPTAADADKDRLYSLNENDDHDLGDELEGYFDADTYFYQIDGLPRLYNDIKVTVDDGFKKVLELDKIKVVTGDDLTESDFVRASSDNDSAIYEIADFAVRKSDTDELVAVYMFKDTLTNKNSTTNTLSTELITRSESARDDDAEPKTQTVEIAKITSNSVNTTTVGATLTNNKTNKSKDLRFTFSKDNTNDTLDNLCAAIQRDDTDLGLSLGVTVDPKTGVLTVTEVIDSREKDPANVNTFTLTMKNVNGYEFVTTSRQGKVAEDNKAAKSVMTVKSNVYSVNKETEILVYAADGYLRKIIDAGTATGANSLKSQFEKKGITFTTTTDTANNSYDWLVVTLPVKTYSANDVAVAVAKEVNEAIDVYNALVTNTSDKITSDKFTVTASNNTITFVDYLVDKDTANVDGLIGVAMSVRVK